MLKGNYIVNFVQKNFAYFGQTNNKIEYKYFKEQGGSYEK